MIALLADIHGNREAMTACLADAERRNAERYVFLGDLVGYGADPGWVIDRAMEYVALRAIAIPQAPQRNSFKNMPMTVEEADRLYVHASADEPSRWHYIVDANRARK